MSSISNWLLAAWVGICSALQLYPDALMQVWLMMPDDLKSAMSPLVVKAVSYSVLVVSFLGKMHSMKRENKRLKDEA